MALRSLYFKNFSVLLLHPRVPIHHLDTDSGALINTKYEAWDVLEGSIAVKVVRTKPGKLEYLKLFNDEHIATIQTFPVTAHVRANIAAWRGGEVSALAYWSVAARNPETAELIVLHAADELTETIVSGVPTFSILSPPVWFEDNGLAYLTLAKEGKVHFNRVLLSPQSQSAIVLDDISHADDLYVFHFSVHEDEGTLRVLIDFGQMDGYLFKIHNNDVTYFEGIQGWKLMSPDGRRASYELRTESRHRIADLDWTAMRIKREITVQGLARKGYWLHPDVYATYSTGLWLGATTRHLLRFYEVPTGKVIFTHRTTAPAEHHLPRVASTPGTGKEGKLGHP